MLALVGLTVGLALGGCEPLGYGLQAFEGHSAILRARMPLERALADPALSEPLKDRIRLSQDVAAFAEAQGLRVGANYRHYSPTPPRAVVYNVFATPPFDLRPIENCFPVVGCVAYRGFFDVQDAAAHRDHLVAQGFDTALFPIGAYSTLGLTPDPLTTAILNREPNELARLILHESVHATLFLGGDTGFDEAMAEAIAEELSLRYWREAGADSAALYGVDLAEVRRLDAVRERSSRLVSARAAEARTQLSGLYANAALDDAAKAEAKAKIFAAFRAWQRAQAPRLAPYSFSVLFAADMNNAHLLAFSLYDELKPQLRRLLVEHFDGDVPAFLAWAESTNQLSPTQRRVEADTLLN